MDVVGFFRASSFSFVLLMIKNESENFLISVNTAFSFKGDCMFCYRNKKQRNRSLRHYSVKLHLLFETVTEQDKTECKFLTSTALRNISKETINEALENLIICKSPLRNVFMFDDGSQETRGFKQHEKMQ